ncbi:post-GPI attachment to proteins factor 3 [Cephus cinctus]|uniref:Post-GPI attachment to proteins factor 3 n=1 Tax=Cephus cinctus TaxID=211228 RepID=A0AAJ7RJU8_CEPCN|nr:post-GPI attachment to proteins factor 3 [Cephus cinctus]
MRAFTDMRSLTRTFFLVQLFLITVTFASKGDKSQFYNHCILKCHTENCKNDKEFRHNPSMDVQLLLWSCKDDCSYNCMWDTVEYFRAHGLQVPQFHGKWPFVRILGLQEPASVLFSLLNFQIHFTMYRKFQREVRSSAPMSMVWTYFSLICLTGWFWSTVFHARDKPFTEAMDYSCAFTIVLTLFYCMILRLIYKNNKAFIVMTCLYISILYTHLSHLWSGTINYGYNMKLNILFGFFTFAITMFWWYRNRQKLAHIYLVGWFNVLTVSVTLLELADFPPIFWVFDAHSLWHASTAPLAVLLYRFIILDCLYLRRQHSKTVLNMD